MKADNYEGLDPVLLNEIAAIVIEIAQPRYVTLSERYGIAAAVLRAGFTKESA